jgi:micrococcal nuclease
MTDAHLYRYNAHITDVYDGDTITANIDLGLNTWMLDQKIRLWAINAPELRGNERDKGLRTRNHLRNLIHNQDVVLRTEKDRTGRYGRWLAQVLLHTAHGWVNINQMLIDQGFATFNTYGNTFHGWTNLNDE